MSDKNLSPEEMQEIIDSLQQVISAAGNIQQRINQQQQSTESDLSEAEEEVREGESDIGQVEQETEQAEEDRSTDELEQVAEDNLTVERILEEQEKIIEKSVQEIEQELRGIGEELEDTEDAEETILNFLERVAELIADVERNLDSALRTNDYQKVHRYLGKLQGIAVEIGEFAQVVEEFLVVQEKEMEEIREEAQEDYKLEDVIHEIMRELGAEEKEVKELLMDSKELKDKNAYQEAEAEEQELEELIQEWKRENSAAQDVAQKLEKIIEESEMLVSEDEKIIEELEQVRQRLESLKNYLIENQGVMDSNGNVTAGKSMNVGRVIKEIEKAITWLKDAENKGRNAVQKSTSMIKQGSSTAKKVWDQAAENSEEYDVGPENGYFDGEFLRPKWWFDVIIKGIGALILLTAIALLLLQI